MKKLNIVQKMISFTLNSISKFPIDFDCYTFTSVFLKHENENLTNNFGIFIQKLAFCNLKLCVCVFFFVAYGYITDIMMEYTNHQRKKKSEIKKKQHEKIRIFNLRLMAFLAYPHFHFIYSVFVLLLIYYEQQLKRKEEKKNTTE